MCKRSLMVLLGAAMLFAGGAQAEGGVSFSRNRLIFPATERAISLTVINHGNSPYLVQAGVSGDTERKSSAPFMVTPPIFRLEGGAQNVMRIVRTGGELPSDRESVFWFYANTIPSQAAPRAGEAAQDKVGASLSISMRTLLKVFWRPSGLALPPEKAPSQMQFSQTGGSVLVKNPTPYYQSFARLVFDGQEQDLDRGPSMVAPFSDLRIPVRGPVHKVTWSVMNDYGGATKDVITPVK